MEFIRRNVNASSGTSSNGSGGGGYSNATSTNTVLETHTIYGLPYNGTNDVRGDLSDVNNITANGDISLDGKIIIKGKDEDGAYNNEDFTLTTDGEATWFAGGKEYHFDKKVIAPKFIGDVEASFVQADTVSTDNLLATEGQIDSLSTDDLQAVNAFIKDLLSENITVDYLTVTKTAHFFELIIDKIKAAGGAVLLTPADGFKVDKVVSLSNGFRLFWKATDGSRKIANMWRVNDLAICQTFNAATGTSYNVSNKYYWCLVNAVGTATLEDDDYHYIDISSTVKDGTVNPEVGDEIAMLGYRGTDDTSRQSAIYIAAYNSIDTTLVAPLIAHYKGINDFNLKAHKYTWFAANGNTIKGLLLVESGQSVEDYVADHIHDGNNSYIHIAYANSADGSLNFTKNNTSGNYLYIGFKSDFNESDASLTYRDYKWTRLRGTDGSDGLDGQNGLDGLDGLDGINGLDGADADFYKLVPFIEKAIVNKDDVLGIQFQYSIAHIVGSTVTNITADTSPTVGNYYVRFRANTSTTYTNLSSGVTYPTYTNQLYQTNYHLLPSPIAHFIIQLVRVTSTSGTVALVDTAIVPVIFAPSATLEITDTIKSTVLGNTTAIGNLLDDLNDVSSDLETVSNSISTIEQRADLIQSLVTTNTNTINTLNGTVNSHTTSISTLTQKADSIESTVSSIKVSAGANMFGFSKGLKFSNCIPFILGYGVETRAQYNRIYNLGFDGEGGDFVVSFEIKAKSADAATTVTLSSKGAVSGGTFTATTTWTKKVLKYSNVTTYIGGVNDTTYNGFLYILNNGSNPTTNYLYIRNLQIERGTTPSQFGVCMEDALNYGNTPITEWTLSNVSTTENGYTVKGKNYTVYQNTSNPSSTSTQKDFIMVNGLILKNQTPYTLSFYAKSNVSGAILTSHLYPTIIDGTYPVGYPTSNSEQTLGNSQDGRTHIKLTTNWKKYYIHWYVDTTTSLSKNIIPFRLNYTDTSINTTATVSMAGIRFEEGFIYLGNDVASSVISQTSSNIKAEVYDEMNKATGIDITNGSITLNADRTTINGNLNIRNSDEGLVVYNDNGNASVIIQNKQIPSISNLNQSVGSYKVVSDFEIDYGDEADIEFDSEEISMGYFSVGDTLNVGGSAYLYYASTSKPIPLSSSVYYKYHFLVTNKTTGTSYTSIQRLIYTTGDIMDGGNFLTPYSFTVSVAGNYSVMLIIHLINEPTDLEYKAVWFSNWDKTVSEYTQIGTDGLVSVKGENNYLYYGDDGFIVRADSYNGLKIKDGFIQEIIAYNGNGKTLWANRNSNLRCANGPATVSMTVKAGTETIGTRNVIRADSTCYDADIITVKNVSSEVWIKLPPPITVDGNSYTSLYGRSLKIKNLTSQRCYVYCEGYKIYAPDSTSSAYYYNIGLGAAELFWTGSEWLWFRCN